MESLQFERLLINPRTALLNGDGVVELRVKRQHVQLHRLAIHLLHGIYHILNKLRIRGSRWVNPDDHLGLLRLLLIRTLRAHLLTIGIDGILTQLIRSDDRRSQQFEQTCRKALSRSGISNNQCRIIQSSQLFRAMVEPIGTSCHQRHQQSTCHKHRCCKLVFLQSLADVLQQQEVLT